MVNYVFRSLVLLVSLIWTFASFAGVSVTLDREEIHINETVRLQIESDTGGESQPDLSPLEQHFKIVGRSSGQNISIVNGQQSVVRRWTIELEPKSVGSFSIDPIQLGSEQSNRFRIAVLPEANSASTGAEVFIEVETDTDTVYVQQQLLLTVRLLLRTRLLDGSLSDPEPDSALVRRVGQDIRYETQRADTTYSVFERRYAIFPQKSGVLEIPPFRFQGLAQDSAQGSQQMFNSLFNQGRRIRANSSSTSINVEPPEASFDGSHWLPAKKVQIQQVGQPLDSFEVGEPVTLKIQLQALGLTAEQLPELVVPDVSGLRFYPDQGIFETQDDGKDVVGIQLKNIALIPNQAGELTLPDIEIKWWNTETGQAEIARLKGSQILVKAAPASTDEQSPIAAGSLADTVADSGPDQEVIEPAASKGDEVTTPGFWKWLALASLGLWLLSALIWISSRLQPKRNPDSEVELKGKPESYWRNRIRSACRDNDPVDARAAVLGWGKAAFGSALTLGQIAKKVADPGFETAVKDLDQVLYAGRRDQSNWHGRALWQSIASFKPASPTKSTHQRSLKPLYP